MVKDVSQHSTIVFVTTISQTLPVEERQQQQPDVSAVHIRIGHNNNTMVAELFGIKRSPFYPQAQSRNQRLQLRVLVDLKI